MVRTEYVVGRCGLLLRLPGICFIDRLVLFSSVLAQGRCTGRKRRRGLGGRARARAQDAPAAERLLEPPRFPLALLELLQALLLRLEPVLRQLILRVLLVPVYQELLNDRRKLAVLVQRLGPILLEIL